ncbi:hypothetical protein RclHR1_19940001 [Rhizophagus clarus]|uniref:Uncharacterized protein n=1 Tax=Rhizophagus clarus TaxID=94130 RepID=A0A2Z6QQB1_9GLOM|nr:hypothetical protein RclHR1_19940001 [Rhizophagus clarus]
MIIGKLIGREGRNIKPIAERTGTNIYIEKNTIPAQIKINVNKKKEGPPLGSRIDEARRQLNDLMKNISEQNNNILERKNNKIKKVKEESKKIGQTSRVKDDGFKKIGVIGQVNRAKNNGFKKIGQTYKTKDDGFKLVSYTTNSKKAPKTYEKLDYEDSETEEINEDLEERFYNKKDDKNKLVQISDYSDEMRWYGVIDYSREF